MSAVVAKLLLVEDNQKLSGLICDCLQQAGYAVACLSRGDQAAYHILHHQPDMVLLDIMLPGLEGSQICQYVRPLYTGKIMMITAIDETEMEVNCLTYGADDYILKPIKTEVLLARVAALLRRPPLRVEQATLSFGPLCIDTLAQTACLHGRKLGLTPSEYNLLHLFASNPNHLLSRDNISRALLGYEYDGADRSIDQKIVSLRRKIGNVDATSPQIKTIHGKGYIFLVDAGS